MMTRNRTLKLPTHKDVGKAVIKKACGLQVEEIVEDC